MALLFTCLFIVCVGFGVGQFMPGGHRGLGLLAVLIGAIGFYLTGLVEEKGPEKAIKHLGRVVENVTK